MLRPGLAGSNTAAGHLRLLREAIEALPPALRRRLMVTCDGAGASRELVKELDRLASRHGYQVTWSVGWALGAREQAAIGKVPASAWEAAIDGKGQVRERRADESCQNPRCAHPACWIEEAHVTELTGLLREGPVGDQLKGWPEAMRVFARRERPHPGAQLSLFETADGWHYSLWATNLPADTRGWRGRCAYADAAHRVHARVEDVIRTGKDTGLGHFPLTRLQGQPGLARRRHDRLHPPGLAEAACPGRRPAKAEPKTLRYRLLHAAARLVRGGRRRTLKIAANWPWTQEHRHRLAARPRGTASHLTSRNPSQQVRKDPGASGTPGHPAKAGPPSHPGPKIQDQNPPDNRRRQPSASVKSQG